jgi:hypothetical protein
VTCCGPLNRRGRECEACYRYRRRTGHERPDAVIVAHGERLLQAEMMAKAGR